MKSNKEMIISVLIVLSVILLVIFLLWFMLGNSPTLEQMGVILVIPVYLFVFGIYERLNNRIINTRLTLQKELGEIKITLAKIEGKIK